MTFSASDDEAAMKLLKGTSMTLQDIKDFEDCEPDEAAALMKGYADDLKVPDKSFWQDLANGLLSIEPYLPIASVLISAIPLL
jgi:hypothetical protein